MISPSSWFCRWVRQFLSFAGAPVWLYKAGRLAGAVDWGTSVLLPRVSHPLRAQQSDKVASRLPEGEGRSFQAA